MLATHVQYVSTTKRSRNHMGGGHHKSTEKVHLYTKLIINQRSQADMRMDVLLTFRAAVITG